MALTTILDPSGLSQGAATTVADLAFTSTASRDTTLTSTGNLPLLLDNEWIEIRNAVNSNNNGLYRVNDASPTTSSVTVTKVSGSDPQDATDTIDTIQVFSHSTTNCSTLTFTATTAPEVQITKGAGTNLPSMEVGERFTVFNHATSSYNGVYEVVTVNTDQQDYIVKSLSGDTDTAAAEDADIRTDMKNLMWDAAARGFYLLEDQTASAGFLDIDGVLGQALYSKAMIDWKDDSYLIQYPFPMQVIDADAGKAIFGQNASGLFNGWGPVDNGTYSIRTRKMIRNMGWSEFNSSGDLLSIYSNIVTTPTSGAFLDETSETTGDGAYYFFGNDTAVNNGVDFTFVGPVNESILSYDATVTRAQATVTEGYDFNNTGDAIDRNDGGSFVTDGYKVGGRVVVANAETSADNGTYAITAVTAGTLSVENLDGSAVTFSDTTDDNTATLDIDNRYAFTLAVRERTTPGNSNARTYSQANLATIGKTNLNNLSLGFGLSNALDLDISETDANIDSQAPYTGMSITYYATAQNYGDGTGGETLVGGNHPFGIVIDGNGGTAKQVYEWTQRQLRRTATNANVDSSTKIGAMLDGLMRFVGPTLEVGSIDGGGTFPRNPDGGGSGVYIDNLSTASKNSVKYFDNTGTQQVHPTTTPVTLDYNLTLENDVVAEYVLFFDRTRTRTPGDLVINAGTGDTGTFTSAGNGLTALNTGAGQYVRVAGLTGGDAAMNGPYQVTAETGTNSWSVRRWDGKTIVTTASSAAAVVDEYCVDTPDAIVVEDDTNTDVTGLISGTDTTFSFDYSNNNQGGRTGGTDALVVARAIGQSGAQFGQSSVSTISSTAVTIPVTSSEERNFANN